MGGRGVHFGCKNVLPNPQFAFSSLVIEGLLDSQPGIGSGAPESQGAPAVTCKISQRDAQKDQGDATCTGRNTTEPQRGAETKWCKITAKSKSEISTG